MEKIVLIHPSDKPRDGSLPVFTPPLGLWSMRSNGRNIEVLDANVTKIPKLRADAVGYSVMFPMHLEEVKKLRRKVTADLEVMGGPTGGDEKIEGVHSVLGPGEGFPHGKPAPFSEIKPPELLTSEMEPYWKLGRPFSGLPSKARWIPIETSRGCPNACGFCAIPHLWGRWQARPLEVLDSYLRYLKETHHIEEILVIDDNAAASVERFLGIIDLFRKHKLSWSLPNGIYNRVLLREEVMRALKNSRCLYLSLPFEAGNAYTAGLMNLRKKYLNYAEAFEITTKLRELGIHTAGQFIIGYPGETEDDVRETLQYANALPLDQRHIHIAMPLPHTPMYETCAAGRFLKGAGENYKTPVIETILLPRKRLLALWKKDRKENFGRRPTWTSSSRST